MNLDAMNPDAMNPDAMNPDNPITRTIIRCISDAFKKKISIPVADSMILSPVHKDESPLMYVLFCELQKKNKLAQIISNYSHIPRFDDNRIFASWYKENTPYLDAYQLQKIHDPDIKHIYNLMFSTKNREPLHKKLYGNRFISLDIMHYVETSTLRKTTYLLGAVHNICVYESIKETNRPDLNIIAHIIYFMDSLAKKYNITPCPVNLLIIASDKKKLLYSGTSCLCSDNINSGSTLHTRDCKRQEIILWRSEELYKVLIHELFHYHSFDFSHTHPQYTQLYDMLRVPDVIGEDSINESFVECMTNHSMCVFVAMYRAKQNISLNDSIRIAYEHEIRFTMFQIAKVIHRFGGSCTDDYLENKIIIKQKTSYRSYFIIKLCLLMNINELFSTMNYILPINERLIEFGTFINKSYDKFINNKNNKLQLDRYIGFLKSVEADPTHLDFKNKDRALYSMRMTSYWLNI